MNRIFGFAETILGVRAPHCTITVFQSGTITPATLYEDAAGVTPLANPFAPDATTGYYEFYLVAQRVDIQFSGTGITVPYTLGDVYPQPQVPQSTYAALPAATALGAGALAQVTDRVRGLFCGTDVQWVSVLNGVANVQWFGARGDGVTNDTAAFQAALTAVGRNGKVVVPAPLTGNSRYAVNITITRSKITLEGDHISRVDNNDVGGGLVPYDVTQPIITVGDGVNQYGGIILSNLEINGMDAGYYGIKILGGIRQSFYNNITIQNFTKKGLWLQTTATQSIAYNFFNGIAIQPTDSAAFEHGLYFQQGNSATFLGAVYFDNLRIIGLNKGWAAEFAGYTPFISNVWMQLFTDHGLLLSKPFTVTPVVYGSLVTLDSNSSTDTLATVNFGSSSLAIEDYFIGIINIDGKVNINGTLIQNASVMHIPSNSKFVNPTVLGTLFLAQQSNPTYNLTTLAASTTSGNITLASGVGTSGANPGNVQAFPNSGQFRIMNTGLASVQLAIQNNTGNLGTITLNGNNLIHSTPANSGYHQIGNGVWNNQPLRLGSYYFWVDPGGPYLRFKNGAPGSATDGTIIGP